MAVAHPWLARDIDAIRRSDLSGARDALAGIGFTILWGMISFDTGGPHERKVFRISKTIGIELLTVDLLLPAFLNEVWDSRETYELEGIPRYIVDRDGLITMKRFAGRFSILVDLDNAARALLSARPLRKRTNGNADDNDKKDNRGK